MASSEKEGSQGEHEENEIDGVAAKGSKESPQNGAGSGCIRTRNWKDLQAAKALLELRSTLGDFRTTTLEEETKVRLKIINAKGIYLSEENRVLTYDEIRAANILMEIYAKSIASKKSPSETRIDSDTENLSPAVVTGTFKADSFEISPEQSVKLKKKLKQTIKRSALKILNPREVNQKIMNSQENFEKVEKRSYPCKAQNRPTGFSKMKKCLRDGPDQTASIENLQSKLKGPADNE